jgi:lysyl endopeptidase
VKHHRLLTFCIACLTLTAPAGAAQVVVHAVHEPPALLSQADILPLPAVDLVKERLADEKRITSGSTAHFAAVLDVDVDPWKAGNWTLVDGADKPTARWLLRVRSPGALSLSLAFQRFVMPEGGSLRLLSADGRFEAGPFTAADVELHGELWTPPLPTDDLLLELVLPVAAFDHLELELTRVHHGYAGFGEPADDKAGDCNSDVACVDDGAWREPARSVALLAIEGVRYCSGFLINNTRQDGRPLLMTAGHCGVNAKNAASVVAMWNFEKTTCDGEVGDLESRDYQTGARLLAIHRSADLVLLELDDPPDPKLGLVYAGWDRSDVDPIEAAVIHHPNTSYKRIAVTDGPVRTTLHLDKTERSTGNHLFVPSWRLGTTEGGSSGAPLFNADRRAVGVLHGGYAACGNHEADWFGRLGSAWQGAAPKNRLRDWLDPLDSQVLALDALVPKAAPAATAKR